jgi:hypothetical protein
MVRIDSKHKELINDWKKDGIKIIDIDTIKTSNDTEYNVKIKY